MSVRIILVDDHQIVRQALKTLLEREPDMEVVAQAEDGRNSVALAKEFSPNLFIMDVKMPDLGGIEASRELLSEFPEVKIIALSMYSDRRVVINMLKAGIHGYLLKDCAFEELVHAIRLVMAHKTYLSSGVTEVVLKDYISQDIGSLQSSQSGLTPREQEVLKLIAEGKKTSQIANLLGISVKTVDTHRFQIMQKLNTRSIAELTKYALREGLIPLED